MRRWDIALGNGHEAWESRFRSKQVVTIGVQIAIGDAVADGEKFARFVEEEGEVHCLRHLLHSQGNCREPANERCRIRGCEPDGLDQHIKPRQQTRVDRGATIQAFAQRSELMEGSLASFRSLYEGGNRMEEWFDCHPFGCLLG